MQKAGQVDLFFTYVTVAIGLSLLVYIFALKNKKSTHLDHEQGHAWEPGLPRFPPATVAWTTTRTSSTPRAARATGRSRKGALTTAGCRLRNARSGSRRPAVVVKAGGAYAGGAEAALLLGLRPFSRAYWVLSANRSCRIVAMVPAVNVPASTT